VGAPDATVCDCQARRSGSYGADDARGAVCSRAKGCAGSLGEAGPAVTPAQRAWRSYLRTEPCAYCYRPATQVDHVISRHRGGSEATDNLTPACSKCNSSKGAQPLLVFLVSEGFPLDWSSRCPTCGGNWTPKPHTYADWGKTGGAARAASLTSEQRSSIARAAALARWARREKP
jgi:hypothetical protein